MLSPQNSGEWTRAAGVLPSRAAALAQWDQANPYTALAGDQLARARPLRKARDLGQHECLVYSSVQGDDRWQFTGPSGEEQSVPVAGPLRSNNLSAVLAACPAGAIKARHFTDEQIYSQIEGMLT